MMNETLKTIAERFSCRSYTDEKISDEHINAIALAATQSPSAMNRQNWQIIMVKNSELLAEMEEEGMRFLASSGNQAMIERIKSRGGKVYYNTQCAVIITAKNPQPRGFDLVDCGIVAQNISLAASSLGIANVHCGMLSFLFSGDKSEEFKQKLRFPEGHEFVLGVLLGYAKNSNPPHTPDPTKATIID